MFSEGWEAQCKVPTCVTTHTRTHTAWHFSIGLGIALMENYFLLAKWTLKR